MYIFFVGHVFLFHVRQIVYRLIINLSSLIIKISLPCYTTQDIKRGYAFVFLRDPKTIEEKNRIETYVGDINGMYVSSYYHQHCSSSLSSSMSTIICST